MQSFDISSWNFNPAFTFDCGQAFRWAPMDTNGRRWIGVVSGKVLKVSDKTIEIIRDSKGSDVSLGDFAQSYFSLTDNLDEIAASFPKDPFLNSAIEKYNGLRILTQDPWECLISFVCAINSNISSIRLKIEYLSRMFGQRLDPGSDTKFYSFPTPESLSKATPKELLACKVGFRWKYIRFLARKVSSGELDLHSLAKLDYSNAQSALISEISGKTRGVGPKVADCVLLFSLHKTEAFPIDVWIFRCLKQNYASHLGDHVNRSSLTPALYKYLSDAMRERFGKYAGYAQQYMYTKMRNETTTQGRVPA